MFPAADATPTRSYTLSLHDALPILQPDSPMPAREMTRTPIIAARLYILSSSAVRCAPAEPGHWRRVAFIFSSPHVSTVDAHAPRRPRRTRPTVASNVAVAQGACE